MLFALLFACSSTQKKTTPELNSLEGKKVALVSIAGEETARKIVEVALVNQLIQDGTFILIPKQEVENARTQAHLDPTDWKGVATESGAEIALRAKVLHFDAPVQEGYSSVQVEDPQLAEEQGSNGKTERLYKVKSMDGHVRIELSFTNLKDGSTRTGIAETQQKVEASALESSIHLPPKLRFLEGLANRAFSQFFKEYR